MERTAQQDEVGMGQIWDLESTPVLDNAVAVVLTLLDWERYGSKSGIDCAFADYLLMQRPWKRLRSARVFVLQGAFAFFAATIA